MLLRYLARAAVVALAILYGSAARAQTAADVSAVTTQGSTAAIIPLPGSGLSPLVFALVTKPGHGEALIAGATAAYTPRPRFHGTDSFRYIVIDAKGRFGPPATVTITVQAKAANPITPPSVRIVQKQLVGADGRRFLVKGLIVRPVIAPFYMEGQWLKAFGDAELDAARSWGANTIRILTSQIGLDPRSRFHSKQYVLSVANTAQKILDHGFLLVVGINDEIGTGETVPHCLPTPATQRAWNTLLALPFAQPIYRDHVMLELFNEPVSAGDQRHRPGAYWWQIWQNGGLVDSYDVGEAGEGEACVGGQKVGMNDLITQLRNAGVENILIADGLGWAHFLNPLYPLTDPLNQLAYGAHPFLEKWPGFQLVGEAGHDYTVLNGAFGDMRTQGPVIATAVDGGAGSGGTGQATHCYPDAPQITPVLLDYLRRWNMGAVGWAFDLPPHSLTVDWEWNPTSYVGFRCPTQQAEGQGGPGELMQQWFRR